MLRTTPIFYIMCWSFFRPHTSTPVLLIVMSLQISAILGDSAQFINKYKEKK